MQKSSKSSHFPLDHQPTLRITTRPNDANATGDIFGGWLMSQIDIAGAIVATDRAKGHVVTVSVKELRFLKPLYIYDLVSFYAKVVKVGNSSLTVEVDVYAQRRQAFPDPVVKVSEATLVYVAVNKPGEKRPVPV